MDKILEGTLGSNHPDELKMALAEKIIQSAATIEDESVIFNVLKCCTDTILNSQSDFNVTMTKRILNGWARVHWDLAGKVLSEELDTRLSIDLIENQELSKEKTKFLEFVLLLMSILRSANGDNATGNVLNEIVSCFLQENDVQISCLMAEIILRNWNLCCTENREGELILKVIDLLRSYSLKCEEITKQVHQVNTISAFFSKIIETDSKFAQFALAEIFNAISQDILPASITLTPLLCCMPSDYAVFAAESICKNPKIKDQNVELVLCKMIDWLAWPDCRKLDVWIVTICKALVADGGRHRLIAAVIKKKAVVVFNHLFSSVSRENALSVFSYMMLLYQHSPEIFHLRPAISPNDFYKVSRPPWFRPGAQQDCSEFLKYLIERIEQEDKHRNESEAKQKESNKTKAGLHEMFIGECRVDVKCLNCHFISSRFEAFNDLPLAFPDTKEDGKRAFPLKGGDISREVMRNRVKESGGIPGNETKDTLDPESITPMEEAQSSFGIPSEERQNIALSSSGEQKIPLNLQSLLESYLSTETLNGQNQYRCDNCASLQDAEQRHYFTSTPKYLILTLKRFTYDIKTHTRGKILRNVHFPIDLMIPVQAEEVQEDELSAYPNTDYMDFEESNNQIYTDIEMDRDGFAADCSGLAVGLDITTKPVLKVVGENNKQYSLIAVIIHSGVSSESGHYYCYCRKKPDLIRQSRQQESNFGVPDKDKKSSRTLSACSDDVAETVKELSRKFYESAAKKDTSGECSGGKETRQIDPLRGIASAVGGTLDSSKECNKTGTDDKEPLQKRQKHVPCSDWYLFNDSIVASVKETDLEKIQKDHPRDTPYVFIYEAIDVDQNRRFLSHDEVRPEISLEVEADNRQYIKEQRMSSKRSLYNAALHSKTRRRDNDKDDDSYGGGPSGNCGGEFGGFGSNAGRFIY
eukprot:Seg2016.8 transcript_id=Seg2016.8/GoldUCD/mRNA.D3Y31 product="Ubiquitin carboxyl-terminal hydrolase 38" protein_id=Seg2016.8/GoldUCD/D3Y31